MLDLDAVAKPPPYELKIAGATKQYDPIVLVYQMSSVAGVEDPVAIRDTVNRVFGLQLDAYQAALIAKDFGEYAKTVDEYVKKDFGRSLFSAVPTENVPASSTDVPQNSNSQS